MVCAYPPPQCASGTSKDQRPVNADGRSTRRRRSAQTSISSSSTAPPLKAPQPHLPPMCQSTAPFVTNLTHIFQPSGAIIYGEHMHPTHPLQNQDTYKELWTIGQVERNALHDVWGMRKTVKTPRQGKRKAAAELASARAKLTISEAHSARLALW